MPSHAQLAVLLLAAAACSNETFVSSPSAAADAGVDAGANVDAGPSADGAVPAIDAPADGPSTPVSDPGAVTCNGAPCDSRTSTCCLERGCMTRERATFDCNRHDSLTCDETADCPSGEVCCLAPDFFSDAWETTCRSSCDSGAARLCKTSAECIEGELCQLVTCSGRTLGSCAGVTVAPCTN